METPNKAAEEQLEKKKLWISFGVFWTAVAIICILAAVHGNSAPRSLSDSDKIMGLSTIWMKSAQFYGCFELVPELDWDTAYQEFIPKVLDTENDQQYYGVLEEFFALLHDGHSGVAYPPGIDRMKTKRFPVMLGYLEENYIVEAVNSRLCSIPLGSVITAIDGKSADDYLEQLVGKQVGVHTPYARQHRLTMCFNYWLPLEEVRLEVLTTDGESYQESIKATGNFRLDRWLSVDPPDGAEIFGTDTMQVNDLGNGIYQVRLPDFGDDRLDHDFSSFISEYGAAAKGFIVDMRGNGGGSTFVGLPVLHHFISPGDLASSIESEQWFTRSDDILPIITAVYGRTGEEGYQDGVRMLEYRYYEQVPGHHYAAAPPKEVLHQPVIVLVDWKCISAGDHIAAFAKFSDRFTLMGTHTAGSTGTVAAFALPGGGEFGISVYRGLQPDGSDYFSRGVQPDIWAEQTVADALQGIDTVLVQAVKTISGDIQSK